MQAPAVLRAARSRIDAAGVFAVTALGFLATGATLPVLPQFVRGPVGGSDFDVGLVTGAFAVAAVLTRPSAGRYADRHGPRRAMVIGSAAMVLSGSLLFIPAGLAGLLLARLVLGFGEGFLFTAASAWIVDLAPEGRRGQVIGLFGLAVWGGLTVGTVLGQSLKSAVDFDAVWALAVITPLLGVLLTLKLRDTVRVHEHGLGASIRAIALPGLALALGNVGYAAFISFIVLDVGQHGGAVITAYAATVVISRLAFGQLPDRLGARACAIGSASAEAVGLAVIALASTWWLAALGAVLMAAGFSLLYPALALIVLERVGDDRRGSAMGLFTAFFDAGMGLGAPLAGIIVSLASYAAAFWAAAALAALAALVLWRRLAQRPAPGALAQPG